MIVIGEDRLHPMKRPEEPAVEMMDKDTDMLLIVKERSAEILTAAIRPLGDYI
jgi:hypothetical protein